MRNFLVRMVQASDCIQGRKYEHNQHVGYADTRWFSVFAMRHTMYFVMYNSNHKAVLFMVINSTFIPEGKGCKITKREMRL